MGHDSDQGMGGSLLSAGLDTTVNGIGNMVYAFATNPGQWDLLRQMRTLKKKAFEESLRWESTVQTFFRTTQNAVPAIRGARARGHELATEN